MRSVRVPTKHFFFDFGCSTIRVYNQQRELLVQEPAVVVRDTVSGEIVATGAQAADLEGKDVPSLSLHHVVQDGLITDAHLLSFLLDSWKHKIGMSVVSSILRPRPVIAVPSFTSPMYQQILARVFTQLGYALPTFVPTLLALSNSSGKAQLIVDIGAGKIDAGIVCQDKMVASLGSLQAGNSLDTHLIRLLMREQGIELSVAEARMLKQSVAGMGKEGEQEAVVRGKAVHSGKPVSLKITRNDLERVSFQFADHIVHLIQTVLYAAPSSFIDEVVSRGIVLTGGGSMLHGLSDYISQNVSLPVSAVSRPTVALALGLIQYTKHEDEVRHS